MMGKIEWGGLKAIAIKIMQFSLNIAWLSRIWTQREWGDIKHWNFEKYIGLKMFNVIIVTDILVSPNFM